MHEKGIIVGCDRSQEWLLEWWWNHYTRQNSHPVAFADFGMSGGAIEWIKEHGIYLGPGKEIALHEISQENRQTWEWNFGEGIWEFRAAWFKKPSALLQSPFRTGIWLDLDCKVCGNLEPLFTCLPNDVEIGLVNEETPEINYNSGVIVFKQNASILHTWNQLVCDKNDFFAGDQDALCHAISHYKSKIFELHPHYNWTRRRGPNDHAIIYHYTGGIGKMMIYSEIYDYKK